MPFPFRVFRVFRGQLSGHFHRARTTETAVRQATCPTVRVAVFIDAYRAAPDNRKIGRSIGLPKPLCFIGVRTRAVNDETNWPERRGEKRLQPLETNE
jgi:hypothetical protein